MEGATSTPRASSAPTTGARSWLSRRRRPDRRRRGRAAGSRAARNDTPGHRPARRRVRHPPQPEQPRPRILGELSPERSTPTVAITATPRTTAPSRSPVTPASAPSRQGITTSATIGDGPHGSAGTDTGDFDFYAVDRRRRREDHRRHRHPAPVARHDRRRSTTPRVTSSPSTTTTAPPATACCCSYRSPADGTLLRRWSAASARSRPTRSTPASGSVPAARARTTSRSPPAPADVDFYAVDCATATSLGASVGGAADADRRCTTRPACSR